MADFDEKLSRILSNPEAMSQIARLAQSLNAPPPMGNPPSAPPMGDGSPPIAPGADGASMPFPPPLAGTNGASMPLADTAGASETTPRPASDAPPQAAPVPPVGTDAAAVAQLLPLLRELGGDSDARRLLYALRPYLRPPKQEKVERALHFARLFRVGKKFLSQWEG